MFICIYGNNILSISVRSDLCYKLQSEARSAAETWGVIMYFSPKDVLLLVNVFLKQESESFIKEGVSWLFFTPIKYLVLAIFVLSDFTENVR